MSSSLSGSLLALGAVALFSTSAVLVRLSAPISTVEVTFWRLALAGMLVLGAGFLLGHLRSALRPHPGRMSVYGLIAALHFGLYIGSLGYTSVANALAIVYTAPAFVALFSALFLGERVSRAQLGGIGVVIVGVGVLAGYDLVASRERLLGDIMALGSAAAFGLYSVAGRRERERFPLLLYAGLVYLAASVWLLPAVLTTFEAQRYTSRNVLAILALAVLPLAVGHTMYNAALRRISAPRANVLSTLEVIGGSLLAWAVYGEPVSAEAALGVALTLAGVLAVIL